MGELPAAGLVRLMVDDEDFDRARAVIGRWESTQVDLSRRPAAAAAPRASWLWGLGGLLLGLIEALGAGYIGQLTGGVLGSHYQDIFAFLILVLVLIFRPSGLLGERVADRA